jgi:hypothetical protein
MTSELGTSQPVTQQDHGAISVVTISKPPVLSIRSWSFLVVVVVMVGLMVALQVIDSKLEPAGIVGLELAGTPERASTIVLDWSMKGATSRALA